MTVKYAFLITALSLFITACSSTPPAPVIERTVVDQPSKQTHRTKTKQSKNNRTTKPTTSQEPNTHIVQQGETLYGIGLMHGHDYKDIARVNAIQPPYAIQVGQKLKLPKETDVSAVEEKGVVTTAVKDANIKNKSTTTTKAATKPMTNISNPKVFREPYSEAAMKKPTVKQPTVKAEPLKNTPAKPTKTTTAKVATVTATKPKTTIPTNNKTKSANNSTWQWPTRGNVSAGFNKATNKGIDITGKKGQAIHAAGKGKVIYTGSDLRGYGKLVIIKHNKTFLSVYAHNKRILVKEGQWVTIGEKIAEMGSSDTNTVKLHFEIREKGKSVDPMQYLPN